jgi:L-cysteine desulfidase
MLANLTGMICDGAKSGCALKIATCTYSAIQSALLATNGVKIPTKEGIIGETAEKTIENFCNLANHGMVPVDHQILEIMLQKT